MANNNNYPYVVGISTQIGWVWKIQGDSLSSFTKKDCEYRIRRLFNGGFIDRQHRDYLLDNLKKLKRGS